MVTLDVFSDVACPFCFIGRRKLQQALAEEPDGTIEVRWRAFQLNPELPPDGVDAHALLTSKFGSDETVRAAHERVRAMGVEVGIDFDFAARKREPNTFLVHRAIALAAREGRADEAVEAAFAANFEFGVFLGDLDEVVRIMHEGAGMEPLSLREALEAGEGADEVEQDLVAAHEAGIQAVPTFVADGRLALSGAHEPELLRRLLQTAREQAA